MQGNGQSGYAFNVTRQTFVATRLRVANTHWSRLVGLLGVRSSAFTVGTGLWIVPSHGVHTLAMRYPIDVLYLDEQNQVIHIEEAVRPWRLAAMRMDCASVLELPSHTVCLTGTRVGDVIEVSMGNGQAHESAKPKIQQSAPVEVLQESKQ